MFFRFFLTLVLLCLPGIAAADPSFWRHEWPQTDFSKTTVPNWVEILSGGPPKDGIPALSDPKFAPAANETRLSPREPVMVYAPGGVPARAYPLRYLMWHEIVNDRVAGVPVAVTFCPLCNTGMVFDRRLGGRVLDFGVSGKLRFSDMIMYDRQTQSWWQQALGTAIVGELTGSTLRQLPATLDSWEGFMAAHPDGQVMAQPGHARRYGLNPYEGYDSLPRPFLYSGEAPPHGIAPLARVLRVGNRAWPLARLRKAGTLREAGLVITWEAGQASALDVGDIGQGRDVGGVQVRDGAGKAVVHDIPFAFAFHAFHPDGIWMLGE